MVSTSCFAGDTASGATGSIVFTNVGLELHGAPATATNSTALIGKASTGVGVGWNTKTTGYALITQHKSGTKAFGSSYDSTAMFMTIAEGTPGTVIDAAPSATDTTDFAVTATWKVM